MPIGPHAPRQIRNPFGSETAATPARLASIHVDSSLSLSQPLRAGPRGHEVQHDQCVSVLRLTGGAYWRCARCPGAPLSARELLGPYVRQMGCAAVACEPLAASLTSSLGTTSAESNSHSEIPYMLQSMRFVAAVAVAAVAHIALLIALIGAARAVILGG